MSFPENCDQVRGCQSQLRAQSITFGELFSTVMCRPQARIGLDVRLVIFDSTSQCEII